MLAKVSYSQNSCNIELKDVSRKSYLSRYPVVTTKVLYGSLETSGKAELSIGDPFEGYRIQAEYKKGVIDGVVYIYDNSHLLRAELNVKQGLREGLGKEYDDEGNCIFTGTYHNDRKVLSHSDDEKDGVVRYTENGNGFVYKQLKGGFYEEVELESKKRTAITEVNSKFERHGKCYFYDEKGITGSYVYNNGSAVQCIKVFDKGVMSEYNSNNVVIYRGEYNDDYEKDYCYEGKGKLFDKEGGILYIGSFNNGKRKGEGKSFKKGRKWYEGQWSDDYPSGQGTLYDENGDEKTSGNWAYGYRFMGNGQWMDYETGEIERKDKNYELSKWMERGGTSYLLKASLPIHSVQTTSALIHSLNTNSKRDAASVTISNGVNKSSSDSDSDSTTDSNNSFGEFLGVFIASNSSSDSDSDSTTDSNNSFYELPGLFIASNGKFPGVFLASNNSSDSDSDLTTDNNTTSYTDKGDDCNCSRCDWYDVCGCFFFFLVYGCCLWFIIFLNSR